MRFVDFQAEATKTFKNAIKLFLDTQLKIDIPPYYYMTALCLTGLFTASMTKIHASDFNADEKKKRNPSIVLMPFWKESRANV